MYSILRTVYISLVLCCATQSLGMDRKETQTSSTEDIRVEPRIEMDAAAYADFIHSSEALHNQLRALTISDNSVPYLTTDMVGEHIVKYPRIVEEKVVIKRKLLSGNTLETVSKKMVGFAQREPAAGTENCMRLSIFCRAADMRARNTPVRAEPYICNHLHFLDNTPIQVIDVRKFIQAEGSYVKTPLLCVRFDGLEIPIEDTINIQALHTYTKSLDQSGKPCWTMYTGEHPITYANKEYMEKEVQKKY